MNFFCHLYTHFGVTLRQLHHTVTYNHSRKFDFTEATYLLMKTLLFLLTRFLLSSFLVKFNFFPLLLTSLIIVDPFVEASMA